VRAVVRRAVAFGVAGALGIHAAHAAEWLVTPTARISTDYTDNPRLLQDDDAASAGAVSEMSASFLRRSERLELSLQPRVRFARYSDDASLDSDDQYVDARLGYVGERSQWSASLNLTRDTTLTSELGSTGFVESNRRHESLALSAGPSLQLTERLNAIAQAYVMESRYPDAEGTGLVDYQYRAMSLSSGFSYSERSTFVVTVQGGELLVPDQNTRTRNGALRLGWKYEPFSLWTAEFSAGPAYVEAEHGEDSGAVFDASFLRQGERTTVSLTGSRELTPTGRGVLTRRDRVVLGTTHAFTQRLNGSVSVQWIRNQDLLPQAGIALYEVDYGRLELGMGWRFAEQWTLALALSGATQKYQSRADDAENYRASLSVIWKGQPRSL
jgi:hypothetical protein